MNYIIRTTPTGKTVLINLIPKNGCTTLANMVAQIDNLQLPAHELAETSTYWHTHIDIHSQIAQPNEIDADIKIAIKRDPVQRFISFWKNRILHHNDFDFDHDSDIDDFIEHYHTDFHHLPTVQEHILPQTYYAGKLSNYTHIYTMKDFEKIASLLTDEFQKPIVNLHLQRSTNIDFELTRKQTKWVKNHFAEDYLNGWC